MFDVVAAEVWLVHVVPPLLVVSIVPLLPVAHPRVGLTKETAHKLVEIPVVCLVQVVPPSLVVKIVPDKPIAHAWLGPPELTPFR